LQAERAKEESGKEPDHIAAELFDKPTGFVRYKDKEGKERITLDDAEKKKYTEAVLEVKVKGGEIKGFKEGGHTFLCIAERNMSIGEILEALRSPTKQSSDGHYSREYESSTGIVVAVDDETFLIRSVYRRYNDS
jgi:hypothetical protein